MSINTLLIALKQPSFIFLIIVNFFPVFGVLFFHWDLFEIFYLYWFETLIIGFYQLLKLIIVLTRRLIKEKTAVEISGILLVLFFPVHFGFMAVAFRVCLESQFGPKLPDGSLNVVEIAGTFNRLRLAAISLLISHGYSFIVNFIGRGEFKRKGLQMMSIVPYGRIGNFALYSAIYSRFYSFSLGFGSNGIF